MTKEQLEHELYEHIPQIPYIIDQVGAALDWIKGELSEGDYIKALKVANDVAKFVTSISNPNFYKTHYVIANLLSNITDATKNERFKIFDSTSKAVENALGALIISPEKIKDNGCFKAMMLHLVPLAKEDENLFAISLIDIKHDLEELIEGSSKVDINEPLTAKDYITVLGYALVIANIRMTNIKMLDRTYNIYNDVVKLLNKLNY